MKDSSSVFSLKEIDIQTAEACNLKCGFCPNSRKRSRSSASRIMSKFLFKKIITEFKKINSGNQQKRVRLFFQNEPLLDPQLIERIQYVKKNIPNCFVIITTNASLLSPQYSRKLLVSGVDAVNLSMLGLYRKTVETIQQGDDYFIRFSNIMNFLHLREKIKPQLKIGANVILNDKISEDEAGALCSFWEDAGVDAIEIWGSPSSRAGSVGRKKQYLKSSASFTCKGFTFSSSKGAWGMIGFLYNGDALFCFNDYAKQSRLGNIKRSSLTDIWQKKANLMNKALHGTAPADFICRYCEFGAMIK